MLMTTYRVPIKTALESCIYSGAAEKLEEYFKLIKTTKDKLNQMYLLHTWAVRCSYGETMLLNIFEIFLNHGLDINYLNDKERTPLMQFIWYSHGNSSSHVHLTVYFMLKHGADLNFVNSKGESAISLAVERGDHEIVDVLIKLGADPKLITDRSLSEHKVDNIIVEKYGSSYKIKYFTDLITNTKECKLIFSNDDSMVVLNLKLRDPSEEEPEISDQSEKDHFIDLLKHCDPTKLKVVLNSDDELFVLRFQEA